MDKSGQEHGVAVTRIKVGNGEVRYEVRYYEAGRGSPRRRRRFNRKADAEAFDIEGPSSAAARGTG